MPDTYAHRCAPAAAALYCDPLTRIDWRQLAAPGPWLPPEALSLYGAPEFEALEIATRHRLSRYEFINVMHCGLWLESIFLQRVSRLIVPGMMRAEHAHLLRELREEAGHSLMFLRAIDASGVELPGDSWRAPRGATALGRAAPAGGALFWLAMLVGEHVSDGFNRYVCDLRLDANATVREICALHVADETRHIEYARHMLSAKLAHAGATRRAALAMSAGVVLRQMAAVFYYPPARFYELAGLANGAQWRAKAARNAARQRFVARLLEPTRQLLRTLWLGIKKQH